MNLIQLFEMQKKLDEKIEKKHESISPNFSKKEITLQRTLALMVEASEFINEVQSFKYWKQNKNISKTKVLEEFVDLLHFFISLSYQNDVPHTLNPKINEYNDINLQFKELFINISEILKQPNKENIQISFEIALGCFEMLGYNYNELFEAYFFKNQKNYKRLYSNY
ncbi:dUTP diphosphatase [Mycoplasmopsis bovirhinis]|uniref:Uncharacterized protein conserved in bacteria n=1 Tax=Mycoplasmopsis bovirhinis TaxID=29553 RepID=A0A449ACT3_9BACT|nr:dUTP diphosphatase [Mycoplasmopsis bovirhinis]VEU62835.1 Uncharacterized protein conserved in bacteria [Mycoplasmopsis bovirhinis]